MAVARNDSEKMSAFLLLLLLTFTKPQVSLGEEYDATVTTDSGSYTVPVEVEDGEVTTVYWPNGGDMNVYGADIYGGEASGYNSRGESIEIEVDGYDESSEDYFEE